MGGDYQRLPITELFNDLRRSNAIIKRMVWRWNGLPSDAVVALFSEETHQVRLSD